MIPLNFHYPSNFQQSKVCVLCIGKEIHLMSEGLWKIKLSRNFESVLADPTYCSFIKVLFIIFTPAFLEYLKNIKRLCSWDCFMMIFCCDEGIHHCLNKLFYLAQQGFTKKLNGLIPLCMNRVRELFNFLMFLKPRYLARIPAEPLAQISLFWSMVGETMTLKGGEILVERLDNICFV